MHTDLGLNMPITMDQHDLFLRNKVMADDADQNLVLIFEFENSVQQAPLEVALHRLVRRHSALRSRFTRAAGGKAHRTVLEEFAVPIESVVRSSDKGWVHLVRDFTARSFDLESGPPIRALVIRQEAGAAVLALTLHHIIADGQSLRIIAAELQLDYAALQGIGPEAPDEPSLYEPDADLDMMPLDFDKVTESDIAYWHRELSGFIQVERQRLGVKGEGTRTGCFPFELSSELTAALQRLSLRNRSSLTGTLCAAFHEWIRRTTGYEDTLVSVAVNMRHGEKAGRSVGNFLRVIPTRIDHSAAKAGSNLVRTVGQRMTMGLQHAVPHRVLRAQALKSGANGGLLDMFMVHHGSVVEHPQDNAPAVMHRRWISRTATRHITELNTVILNDRLNGELVFGAIPDEEGDAAELGRRFVAVLQTMAASSDTAQPPHHKGAEAS